MYDEDMTPLEREQRLHIILGDIRALVREYIRLYEIQHPDAQHGKAHLHTLHVANYAGTTANDDPVWDWYRQEWAEILRRSDGGEQ